MHDRATFPSATTSVGDARRWAGRWCRDHDCNGQTDLIALVISELVTNAVVHGEGVVEVGLERHPDRIDGFVRDQAPGTVTARPPSDEIGGWGLLVVTELTAAWSVESDAQGKSIGFQIVIDAGP